MSEAFDTYNRRARLYPAALVASPISAVLVVLFVNRPAWWTALVALAGTSGATYFVTQLVRSIGRAGEIAMWQRWGGAPTTVGLRYSGATNRSLVDRRHRLLAQLFPLEHLPSEAEEQADPTTADSVYDTVVGIVRARTRDQKRFGLLFIENCSYGFRRNLLACKPYAYVAIAVSLVGCAILLRIDGTGRHPLSVAAGVLLIVFDLLMAAAFRFMINEAWVKDAGESYAQQLFEAVETLAAS